MQNDTKAAPEASEENSGVVQLELTVFNPETGSLSRAFNWDNQGEIVIREDLSYEEWNTGLRAFKWAQTKLKLDFAKYISYGDLKYGKERVEFSLGQLEFNLPLVSAALAVNSIPEEIRHDNLEAEHYVVLARANMVKSLQKKWAKTASDQNLTPVQLKYSIEAGEVVTDVLARKNTHGILSIHGLRQEFDIWLKRVKGAKGILKMKPEEREEIIGELKAFVDLYQEINEAGSK